MLKLCSRLRELPLEALLEIYTLTPRQRQDTLDYLRRDFFRTPGAMVALWEGEGQCLSALRLEPYRDGLLICALGTHSACRNRGHATALLRAVRQSVPGSLYAHVAKDNIPSLAAHKNAGFQIIQDTARYLDGSVDGKSYTLKAAGNGELTTVYSPERRPRP